MSSSRAKPFSGKKKKEQLQLKNQIKNLKLKNHSVENCITESDIQVASVSKKPRGRINLLSDWDTIGSKPLNPRNNPEYQNNIISIDKNWRQTSFEQIFGADSSLLSIPTRPKWNHSFSAQELDDSEQQYFQSWITETYEKAKTCGELSFFEHNIEVWRQLWRVCEISNVLIIVADIRNPIVHLPFSLYLYIANSLEKPLLIALTKSDLVSKKLREEWKKYLNEKLPNVRIHFVSTFDSDCELGTKGQKRYVKATGIVDLLKDIKSISNCPLLNDQFESVIDSVQSRLDSEFKSTQKSVSDTKDEKQFTIGFIGQPNVGKSSLINSIFGKTVVSASKTPGHTKHFQTMHLSSCIRVCDSPGLVFPSIIEKNLQILSGIYNIAQVKDPYGPILYLSKRVDLFKALKIFKSNDPDQPDSVFYICEEYAKKIGFFTSKAGRPDTYRAANLILRQVIDGKILLFWTPPGFDENISEDAEIYDLDMLNSESGDEYIGNEEEEESESESEIDDLKNFESQCQFSLLNEEL